MGAGEEGTGRVGLGKVQASEVDQLVPQTTLFLGKCSATIVGDFSLLINWYAYYQRK